MAGFSEGGAGGQMDTLGGVEWAEGVTGSFGGFQSLGDPNDPTSKAFIQKQQPGRFPDYAAYLSQLDQTEMESLRQSYAADNPGEGGYSPVGMGGDGASPSTKIPPQVRAHMTELYDAAIKEAKKENTDLSTKQLVGLFFGTGLAFAVYPPSAAVVGPVGKKGAQSYNQKQNVKAATEKLANDLGITHGELMGYVGEMEVSTPKGTTTFGNLSESEQSQFLSDPSGGSGYKAVVDPATARTIQQTNPELAQSIGEFTGMNFQGTTGTPSINPILQKFESEMGDISFIKSMSDLTGIGISDEDNTMIDNMVKNSVATLTENVNEQNVTDVKNTIAGLVDRGIMDSTIGSYGLAEIEKGRQKQISQGTREFETWGMGQKVDLGTKAKDQALNLWGQQGDLATKMGSLYTAEKSADMKWDIAQLNAASNKYAVDVGGKTAADKLTQAYQGMSMEQESADKASEYGALGNIFGSMTRSIWDT